MAREDWLWTIDKRSTKELIASLHQMNHTKLERYLLEVVHRQQDDIKKLRRVCDDLWEATFMKESGE